MKKIITANVTSTVGMPVKSGTIMHLQNAYTEITASAIINMIPAYDATRFYILYGCEASFTAPLRHYTEGAVFHNGQVYQFPAQSVSINGPFGLTVIANISSTYFTDATADPVIFTDNNPYNVHLIETIQLTFDQPSQGIGNYSDFIRLLPPNTQTIFQQTCSTNETITFETNKNIFYGNYGSFTVSPTFALSLGNAAIGATIRLQGYFILDDAAGTFNINGATLYAETGNNVLPQNGINKVIYLQYLGIDGNGDYMVSVKYYNLP